MKSPVSVLTIVSPVSLVLTAVGPDEDIEILLVVEDILPGVSAPVRPHGFAHTMAEGFLPNALIQMPVAVDVKPRATNHVRNPRAPLLGAAGPHIDPLSVLLAVPELALKA